MPEIEALINAINDADEIEILEFNFDPIFSAIRNLELENHGFRQLLEEIKAIFDRCDKCALGTCTLQGEPSFNVIDTLLYAINRELHKEGEL